MVNKTLQIDKANARELHKIASKEFKLKLEATFGKEFFDTRSISEKINNLKDLYKYNGLEENSMLIFKDPISKFERHINACALIPLIVSTFNEGTILDWNNDSVSKYLPYYKNTGLVWAFADYYAWYSGTSGSASHHYKDPELLKTACNKFNSIYVDFYSFNG